MSILEFIALSIQAMVSSYLELLPALAAMVGPGWNLAGPAMEPPVRPPYEG